MSPEILQDKLQEILFLLKGEQPTEDKISQAKVIIKNVGNEMHDVVHRDRLLRIFSSRLAVEQQWELAKYTIEMIRDRRQKMRAMQKLGMVLSSGYKERRVEEDQLVSFIKYAWSKVETREEALELFPLVEDLISVYPDMVQEFRETFKWVEEF